MRKKLRSSKGMMLTELLVALAIVALIGVSLTVGVSSAAKIYRDATRLSEAETLCGTILTCLEDEFRFSSNIRTKPGTETVDYFNSQVFGEDVQITCEDGKIKIGGIEKFDLLTDSTYTSGLKVSKCEISYNDKGQVKIKIGVGPKETNKIYAEHEVTVTPVGN